MGSHDAAVLVVVPLAAGIGAADASSGTPSAPVIGTATGGNGQVTVTWTVPANDGSPITSFIISGTYVSGSPFDGTAVGSDTVDAGSVGSSTDPTPGASDSFVYAGLANGVGYSFSIEAANANGAGTASAQSNTATTGTTPQAPSSLVAVAGSQAVQLNWTVLNNGGSPVTDFVVTPSIGSMAQAAVTIPVGAVGSALDPTPFSSDSYELGGLANGTAYTFTIAATNSPWGTGTASSPTATVTPSSPLAPFSPTNVTASSSGANINLTWTVPPDNGSSLTTYAIFPQRQFGSPETPISIAAASAGSVAAGATAHDTISGLLLGTHYQFGVEASNATGSSTPSLLSNLATPSAPVLFAEQSSYTFEPTTVGDVNADDTPVFFGNSGSQTDNVTRFVLGGSDPDDFVVDQNECTSVQPNTHCSVDVAFVPGAYGTRTATLTPIDGSANPPTVTLVGQGTEGYYIASADGEVDAFGDAQDFGDPIGDHLKAPIVSIASTGDDGGYWLVASDGGIFSYGDAAFYGSTGGLQLNKPIVGMAPTPDDGGYWLVASDGGIFAFGDAPFYGSTGAIHLNKPIVGMATTPDGDGYWLVASDGGIFAFGDAPFYGSTGAIHLNKPIVGMATTPEGGGYWLVASDGGIFAFGDAPFYGSTGAIRLNSPIVGMTATPDGGGYWMVAQDGGIFAFGDAPFQGSDGANGITGAVSLAGSGPPTIQAILGIPADRSRYKLRG